MQIWTINSFILPVMMVIFAYMHQLIPSLLAIGAESPEEIAISIAAQLVATRASQRGKT